jgi:hypothetical protein
MFLIAITLLLASYLARSLIFAYRKSGDLILTLDTHTDTSAREQQISSINKLLMESVL